MSKKTAKKKTTKKKKKADSSKKNPYERRLKSTDKGDFTKRHYKLTPSVLQSFLDIMSLVPNKARAAKLLGIQVSAIDTYVKNNSAYAEALEQATAEGCERLYSEAWRRAHDGVDKVIYYKGKEVGKERVYSDAILIRLLEAHDKRFTRKQELSTPDGQPLTQVIVLPPEDDPPT